MSISDSALSEPSPEDSTWLSERQVFEAETQNRIVVEQHPKRWHSDFQALRLRCEAALKAHTLQTARLEKEMRKPHRTGELNMVAIERFDYEEGGLIFRRHIASAVRVTAITFDRALAIGNALFVAADRRGCTCKVSPKFDRIVLELEGACFQIALRERQITHEGDKTKGDRRRPTDRIALAVEDGRRKFEVVDHEGQRVEDRLSEVFSRLYEAVVRERIAQRIQDEKERLHAIRNEAYFAITKERAAKEAQLQDDAKKSDALVVEAKAWMDAMSIRAYAEHIKRQAGSASFAWYEWAISIADNRDPTQARLISLHTQESAS